jgi:hypothetical protein
MMAGFAYSEDFGPLHIEREKYRWLHKAVIDSTFSIELHFFGI